MKVPHEDLLRIVELVRSVERTAANPFEVDVRKALETLRKHLPSWTVLDDLVLDARALNEVSYLVKLQDEWVRHRASSVYVDPALLKLRIMITPIEDLARSFSGSWHPIVGMSQLFPNSLIRAMDYWNSLLPLGERFKGLGSPLSQPILGAEMNELLKMRILSQEEFKSKLNSILKEARESLTNNDRSVDYWGFVKGRDWDETVMRAYLITFLVSDGLLTIEHDLIEDKTSIAIPNPATKTAMPKSVVISLSRERFGA